MILQFGNACHTGRVSGFDGRFLSQQGFDAGGEILLQLRVIVTARG